MSFCSRAYSFISPLRRDRYIEPLQFWPLRPRIAAPDSRGWRPVRSVGLASGLGIGGPHDSEMEEALAVLKSRQFTESFIANEKLMPKLFADRWDAVADTWKSTAKVPTPSKAYNAFDKIRAIVQDKKTGLITLEIEWTDRNDAAAWVNELVRELNQEMRARAIEQADASMRFLQKELRTTATVEERDALNHLVESQVKQRMLANVTQDYSFRIVDKAIASDKDDQVKPQKRFLVMLGALLGLMVGVVGVLLFGFANGQRK